MRHLRAALGLVLLAELGMATSAYAQEHRQVILILTPGRPYEDVVQEPLLGALAERGGIGLMTTSGEAQEANQAAVSLGAGRSAVAAPPRPVSFENEGAGLVVDAGPYRRLAGEAEPGLLGTALVEAGRTVGYVDPRASIGDPAMLVAMDHAGRIPLAALNGFPPLAELSPEFLGKEVAGVVTEADLVVSPDPEFVPFALQTSGADQVMVLVVAAPPSGAMRARRDTVTPVVLATGTPGELLGGTGAPGGLMSETTRRQGLVSNVDVAPTALEFLGVPVPGEMLGSPIKVEGTPPTDLHRRFLEWRGVVKPVGWAVLAFAHLALVSGLALIFGPWQPSRWLARAIQVAALGPVGLLVTLVPASLLPTFAWPVVIATVAGGGAILVALAQRIEGRRSSGSVALIALAGLALVVVDVAAGWRTALTPLLGGTALDGERFFGLGNPYAGMLMSGAILGAAVMRPRMGVALITGAAAFAGLPFLGGDVGGSITLAVVAALWYGMNRWGGLGPRTWTLAASAALAAVAALIVSHRLFTPGETHVSRAVSEAGGILGAMGVFWERLLLNIRLTSQTPSVWPAVVGLPVWLAVALLLPARLGSSLGADPGWRRAVTALAIGGILGFVLNDTPGTAGITFLFVSAAIVYPALAIRRRREDLTETVRAPGLRRWVDEA